MSKIDKILTEVYKSNEVNLESHKIELSDIKTLKSDAERMKKGINELNSLRQQMKKIYMNSIDKANTNRSMFGQKAKEIGVDPNTIPEYKNFFDLQSKLDNAYYDANK